MDPVWQQHYPPGVPTDISEQLKDYESLIALFEESCARFVRHTAYISMGTKLSYGELDEASRCFAAWLQSIGVQKGDRIALMMPNVLQYPVCLFGAWRAGAVVVNTNPLYTADELEHQLSDAGAEIIVVAENFAHTVEKALPRIPLKHIVVTGVGDMLGRLKAPITNFLVRNIKKLVPSYSLPGAYQFSDILVQGKRCGYQRPALHHKDLACLQYTGGTTGVAKGCMLTHGNLVANVCQAHAWINQHVEEGKECIVTALPLYHIFALMANCLTFLKLGATNLLILNPRDIPAFVKELSSVKFTAITGVNTLFNALLNNSQFAQLDFSHLKIALGGGMAVQEAVAQRWMEVTGTPLTQAYGLTETSPAVTINPLGSRSFNGSIGLPIPSTEIAIRDSGEENLGIGEIGEICVRGPQVTPGYWNRPEETEKAFDKDGFLRTGDIGLVDEQGYIFIKDRKKDMIVVSGFNVYPNELEAVIAEHPDILEAAAIGVPDEHSGESVKLFVIARNPALTEKEVIEFCRSKLTRYKCPREVIFRKELPRSNVGKILRRELREEVLGAETTKAE
ncbi:MAG TPA: AMP-binding protein [Burkholderiaceae bacterium]|nr:AMP-binding protein [Burkholderiaceae bacterium]